MRTWVPCCWRSSGVRSTPRLRELGGYWLRRYRAELGNLPVFADGSGIEVQGLLPSSVAHMYEGS